LCSVGTGRTLAPPSPSGPRCVASPASKWCSPKATRAIPTSNGMRSTRGIFLRPAQRPPRLQRRPLHRH
jgi:hypothetical protein